jgi:hypothetical protein
LSSSSDSATPKVAKISNSGDDPNGNGGANSQHEENLAKMEALLSQSAKGIHVLFETKSLVQVLNQSHDEKDFYDFEKMKKVQDVMTELIAKKTYLDKVSYLKGLDQASYNMLVRAYFHIVENTVRASSDLSH